MARAQVIATYKPSDLGWLKIANSNAILRPCLEEANKGMAFAKSISPVKTGSYQQSFGVKSTVVTLNRKGPRTAAELYNDDPAAAPIEFGNKHVGNPHRVMRRTGAYLSGNPNFGPRKKRRVRKPKAT